MSVSATSSPYVFISSLQEYLDFWKKLSYVLLVFVVIRGHLVLVLIVPVLYHCLLFTSYFRVTKSTFLVDAVFFCFFFCFARAVVSMYSITSDLV